MYRGTIKSVKDIKDDWDIYDTVTYKGIKTTVGRVIFNSYLPKGYPFINEAIDKKKLDSILLDIFHKYGDKVFIETINKICKEGFKSYTLIPKSFSLDDLEPPPEILKLKAQLVKTKTVEEFDKLYNQLIKELQKFLAKHNYDIYDIVKSGSRGNWKQIAQILIAKGLVVDPSGNVLPPVKSSFSDGLRPSEFFWSGAGARSGVVDRALSTATTGYLTRRLIYATQSVLLGKKLDCKTKKFLTLKVTPDLKNKIIGRYLSNGTLISEEYVEKLVGKVIELRSPIFCKSSKICRKCYGKLADYIGTDRIGILAAESIGERGTQIIMRTFHLGGAVSFKSIDVIKALTKYVPTLKAEFVASVFEQKDNQIFAKKDITIVIAKEDYPVISSLTYDKLSGDLLVQTLVGQCIVLNEGSFDLILSSAVLLKNVEFDGKNYIKTVKKGEIAFELKIAGDSFAQAVQQVINILEGRIPWRTVEQLLLSLYQLYKDEAKHVALVHYEVILSNLLRARKDPYKPARLVDPWDPVFYGLKKVPYIDGGSWLLGLAFENSKKAVEQGLLSERPYNELSPLERVLLGVE